jgi:type II secretory pathway pseudopilin PulG
MYVLGRKCIGLFHTIVANLVVKMIRFIPPLQRVYRRWDTLWWRSVSGWTVIELVLVTAIAGIMVAVAMIQFGTLARNAKDAALQGLAGAYSGQLVIAIKDLKRLPTGGGSLGLCVPSGPSNRFRDCVYGRVPNPTLPGFTRSTYNNAANRFNICSDTNAAACTNALTAAGCGSSSERFIRVTYTPATGRLNILGPFNCLN